MQDRTVELSNVIHDSATERFVARAIVHDGGERHAYACEIAGPINLPFAEIARRLTLRTLRLHDENTVPLPRTFAKPAPLRRSNRLRRGLPLGQYGYFRGRSLAA